MPELTTYLQHLTFDPKLLKSTFARYLQNTRLVILLLFLILLIGITSFLQLPRVLNPQIKIPIVIVSTTLPGASSKDIEALVTIPLEDSLTNLSHVKTLTSSSQDSVSIVTLEFDSGVDPDKAKADVQSAVDSINDLPTDATSPHVQKLDFENTPIWTFTLSSKQDYMSLSRFAKNLKDELKDLATIDKVETSGLDNEEIQVIIHPNSLAQYGLSPISLSQALKGATGSFPAGAITTSTSSFVLTLDPTITTLEELRKLRISSQGQSFFLSDVADVMEKPKPNTQHSYIATNEQKAVETIRFDIYKTSNANITQAVEEAKHVTQTLTKSHGNLFTVSSVLNSGEEIDKQYYDLIRDLLITVSLVFFILFLFLGLRQAIVASFAIPLTFLINFIVMSSMGMSLSFIAFFSLLLSLGLLVDDTIVVISALTSYYRTNKFTPLEAALLVWRDFRTAIITTTLTTVWAFVPLLLSTGIIGEFIKPIPIVVSSTLLASLGVALFITPPFIMLLLNANIPHRVVMLGRIIFAGGIMFLFFSFAPKGIFFLVSFFLFVMTALIYMWTKKDIHTFLDKKIFVSLHKYRTRITRYVNNGIIPFEQFEHTYRGIIDRILSTKQNRTKAIGAVVVFTLFSYLLLPLGFVHNEFFPKSDQNFLYLSLELPAGTNLTSTNTALLRVVSDIRKGKDVEFVTATTGLSIDPGRGYSGSSENTALITVVLPPLSKRSKTSMDIAEELRNKYAGYTNPIVTVMEESGGPPAGSDIQIKLLGPDLGVLDTYASTIQTYLQQQPGIANVSKSIKSGTSKIVFIPDYQKLLDAGITQDQVGFWLRVYASGFTLEQDAKLHQDTSESRDIVLRTDSLPQQAQGIQSITIPSLHGPIPLETVGTFVLRPNPTLITREDGKRTLSISAGVKKGVVPTELNAKLEKFANNLNLPQGYSWKTGGANEENQRSVTSILQAMILSFLLIIVTMVLQFSSFRKALIVMLVIPLSISGVFIVFSLSHTPLSFPALIGILALFGIVVKNSILIVDKINQNLKHMSFRKAIVDASVSRLEPITLTSFATIVGLIPITLSDPLWRGLGGAIIAGLFFSGTLMLFFIPVVYYVIFQHTSKTHDN